MISYLHTDLVNQDFKTVITRVHPKNTLIPHSLTFSFRPPLFIIKIYENFERIKRFFFFFDPRNQFPLLSKHLSK